VQEYGARGIRAFGPQAALLAEAEGLIAHAEAIHLRIRKASRNPDRGESRGRRARA
jgi:histidinol dehydrogenase